MCTEFSCKYAGSKRMIFIFNFSVKQDVGVSREFLVFVRCCGKGNRLVFTIGHLQVPCAVERS